MKNQNATNKFYARRNCLRIFLFTLLTSGFMIVSTNAQPLFTRTTFNASYVAIATGSGATVSTATGNDVNQTAISLGFTFNYAGTNYTTLGLNTNGLIWFDAAAPSATDGKTNDRLVRNTGTNQSIAPWWNDLTDDASSDILYQTQGSAGSKTFTIQYTNYPTYTGTPGSNVRMNCQVIFYEGTNVIEFRYGSLNITGAQATSGGAVIGIEYGTGGPGNYIDAITGSSTINHRMLSPVGSWPSYNFRFTPGSPIAIAAGTYNVGVGQTYPSLTQAVADLNHRGISGPVTLNLTDATYDTSAANGKNIFPIIVAPVAGTSAVNILTISKTGAPATIAYSGSAITQGSFGNESSSSAISDDEEPIVAVGGSYTTISNVNLVAQGSSPQFVEIGLLVFEAGPNAGAQYNVFDRISVDLDRTNTNTIGIYQKAISSGGSTNSYNIYRDLNIHDCYTGIYLNALGSGSEDFGNQITTSSCTKFNLIGDAAVPNDIGGNTSEAWGIRTANQSAFTIQNCIVRNVSTTSSTALVDGLRIENALGTCSISNNVVQTIKRNSATGTAKVSGIRISHAANATVRVFNNSVSEILSSYSGAATATRVIRGIYLDGTIASNSNPAHLEIWNNSVSIDGGASPNASNACFETATATANQYVVENNAFANFTAAQTGVANHYCWVTPSATSIGSSISVSDYNDLYVANDQGTSGYVGLGSATKYATLSSWQSGITINLGTDAHSVSSNPFFVNNTSDLHSTSSSTTLDGSGTTIPAYYTTDIDCDPRTIPADIGSDDAGCDANGGTITPSTASVCASTTYVMSPTGYTDYPSVTYQWMKSNTPGGPYSNVIGGSGANTPAYTTGSLSTGTFYYVLKATCPLSGFDLSNELTLTVKAAPAATITPAGPTTFCSGGSVVLDAPITGNRSYQWKKGNANISGATSSSYIATSGASYKVLVTNTSTGCSKTSPATTVTVNALPAANITPQGPTTFCAGGSVVLQANTGVGITYKWKKGNNYLSGETSFSYTAITQGNYKVEVTDVNSCSKLSAATMVTVPCKEEESTITPTDHAVSIFPNPATTEINIALSSGESFEVEIVNSIGESVSRIQNQNIIDVSDLASGIYFVKIYTDNDLVVQKFIKQ